MVLLALGRWTICGGEVVEFTNTSVPQGNFWFWDFGDGTLIAGDDEDTDQHPTHEYRDLGCFNVEFFVFFDGCDASIRKDMIVCVEPSIAEFEIDKDCDDPFNVTFTDLSKGADNYSWDFGDPNTTTDVSSLPSPSWSYTDEGLYTITLTTSNNTTGCTDSYSLDLIVASSFASFDYDPKGGCFPVITTVTADTAGIVDFRWTAPGAVIEDNDDVTTEIEFRSPGSYEICLIAEDATGCIDTMTVDFIANDLDADFDVINGNGCIPLNVTLQNTSNSLVASNQTVEWIVGLDSIAILSGETANIVIDSVGIFAVTMIVEDDTGCRDSITRFNVINAQGPIIQFEGDTVGCVNTDIEFTNMSLGSSLSYMWDFGDSNTSTAENPVHQYTMPGVYDVCLTIEENGLCVLQECKLGYVNIGDPEAMFTFGNTGAPCPPLEVDFMNQSTGAISYLWDFGDNSGASTLTDPSHIYAIAGLFDVQLVAEANSACRDTFVFRDLIVLEGPQAIIELMGDTAVCQGNEIVLVANGMDDYSFIWDLGDGTVINGGSAVSTDTVRYTYATAGVFRPTISVTDVRGCDVAYTADFFVNVLAFDAEITVPAGPFCVGDTVFLESAVMSDILLNQYEWDLAGSVQGSSTDTNTFVTYDTPGMYDIVLNVAHAFCGRTLTEPIEIGSRPTAAFDLNVFGGCLPFDVDFNDLSNGNGQAISSWIWDFGDGQTSTDQNPSNSFTALQDSFIISLIVETGGGCSDTTTQIIYATQGLAYDITPDTIICIGQSIDLEVVFQTDPTGVSFEWAADPTLSCTACLIPTATPMVNTTYSFTADDGAGCMVTKTVVVQVDPTSADNIMLSPDQVLCPGDSVQLNVSGGNSLMAYTWDMSRAGLSCYTDCDDPWAKPTVTTTYIVTVDNGRCAVQDSVLVTVGENFSDFATGDTGICPGDQAQLNVTQGINPIWIVSDSLSCIDCPNPMANPIVPTTYIVEVESAEGCISRDSVFIDVVDLGVVSAGDDTAVCLGEDVQLQATGNGTYAWTPAGLLDDATVANPIAMINIPTTFTVTVSAGTCSLTDDIFVDVVEKAEIESFTYTLCQGDSIMVEVTGSATGYSWSPAESLADANAATTLAFPQQTTTYTIIGSLGSCPGDTTMATVNVVPALEIIAPDEISAFPGQPQTISVSTNSASGNISYAWSNPSVLSCANCPNPIVTPGNDDIVLTVTAFDQDAGCSNSKDILVMVDASCSPDLIYVPNVFSPNEDGNNDYLEPQLVIPLTVSRFTVMDRWGSVRYQADNIIDGWDGYSDGQPLDEGVYVYFIEATCPFDGVPIIKSGDVTIVR